MEKIAIGTKIAMSQRFLQDGSVVPVTLVRVEPAVVTDVKTMEKDGYEAVQLGSGKAKHVKKPQAKRAEQFGPVKYTREFRTEGTDLTVGTTVDVSAFIVGDRVDVKGTSKGKGFQGVVKRHHFHGHPSTHGHKDQLRMSGSIGAGGVQHVIKGMRMGGRMGGETVTVKNLEVVEVDTKANTLAIKGAIPGCPGGLVLVRAYEGTSIWQR